MLIVGLTGGIGSGKSAAAEHFARLGVPIIDSDLIARQMVVPGQAALAEITEQFGDGVLTSDGQLNRPALRQLIFADSSKRDTLEAILHPRIRTEMLRQATLLNTPYTIFVIPLLVETGQQALVNHILVIDCDDEIRRQRLKQRDQMNDTDISNAFAAQASREQRLAGADEVINNSGDIQQLLHRVEQLHHHYSQLAPQYQK